MFVAASTHCFADKSFDEALQLITDLEYDKVELWMSEATDHLKPSQVVDDTEAFLTHYRKVSRLTPIAFCLEEDVDIATLTVLAKLAKSMKITQITVPASPVGTPFNTEVDRLRSFQEIASQDGIRLSLKTKTGQLTEDPHTAVELCQAAPGIGLTLDPSYYICGPHKNQNYDQVFPFVSHVHLRDTSTTALQVPTGLGEIEYSRLISMLQNEQYDRALSVDLITDDIDKENRPLEMRKLRMLLDSSL